MSVLWRLAVQSVASLLVVSVYTSGGDYAPGAEIYRFVVPVFIFLWVVWLTNAYNFMDGIDGIAGLQAVVAGVGWLAAGIVLQQETIWFYGGILAFSGFGFLIQNWQPAKIFMGDVGSAFLGYTFAVLPVLAVGRSEKTFGQLFITAAALLWLFIFDTVFTFCRRALDAEKVWKPHRTHIYQRLVARGFSHRRVAAVYAALTTLTGIFAVAGLSNADYNAALYGAAAVEAIILILLLRFFFRRSKIKSKKAEKSER